MVMMLRLFSLCLLPALLLADSHWIKFQSGPFEVYTDAGSHPGREALVRFEEFRNALGQVVGENDLQTPQPIRIFVFKNANGWTSAEPIVHARDRFAIVLQEKGTVTPELYAALTRLFLKSNTAQMPPSFEHGLVEFFSTFQVSGIHITAGTPPAKPDLDWARIHLLVTDHEYFGKVRVLLYNLRKGVDQEAAYRNAFAKSPAQVEAQVKSHFAAGNFQTTTLNSRPLSEGDFQEREVADSDARLARADLLTDQSAAEYRTLLNNQEKVAEAHEGLGLLALRAGQKEDARKDFAAAIAAGSSSARCYIEYARLEPDNEKATQALLKAAGINPKLDEPFVLMAQRDTDPRRRLMHWKDATERNPREPSYWEALANCYLADHNYTEAAKAWRSGEQAAIDPAVKQKMHEARLVVEQQRLDYEAEEKRRQAEEEARDIGRLKAEARAHVHELERQANNGQAPKSDSKAVAWWDGPKPGGKAVGTLKQIDCLGKQFRLVVESDSGKSIRLLIPDASSIALSGGGEQSLTCGAQKPRPVVVEYFPKANARTGTAGEVATIEFQ
jgi:hypothetical protein